MMMQVEEIKIKIKEIFMEELITKLQNDAGLSQEQAKNAYTTTLDFIKEKLPMGLGDKVEDLLNGNFDISSFFGGSAADDSESPIDKMKGLMGNK